MSWSWWGVPSAVTLILAWTAAFVVLRTRPDRAANRRLSVVLVLEGLFIGCASGLIFMVDSPAAAFALGTVATAAMATLVAQYLAFLGASLDTPLVRPFRSRKAVIALAALSGAAATLVIALPERFVTAPYQPGWAAWNYQLHGWGNYASQLYGVTGLFGLVAALSAFLRTPRGSAARTRAKWFAIAFGVRDAWIGAFQLAYPLLRPLPFWGDVLYNPATGAIFLLYVLLLSYGVLHAQLFDIQLRVKLVLRQSTVVAVITGAFFVASEILETFIPADGVLIGVLAAAICVIALRPLRSLALRLSSRVMRDVEPTAEYFESRKLEVYRAALEGALEDGIITDRERVILRRLIEQLEIAETDAERMEAELAAAL